MKRHALMRPLALALVAWGLSGCADDSAYALGAPPDAGGWIGGGGAGGGGAPADAGALPDQSLPPLPPEEEVDDLAFTPPAAGARHVWIASPSNDLVVRVDARSRAVATYPVGEEPTVVRTVPGQDVALAFSRGSDELALFRLSEPGAPESVRFFNLPGHFNRLELEPAGRYAFLWFNVDDTRPGERTADQQLMAVFDVQTETLAEVAVGFRPRQLFFRQDTVYVVTDDGLSVVEPAGLPTYSVAPQVPLVDDALARQNREVLVGADGRYVVSRALNEASVTVVSLADGARRAVRLPEVPSDVDFMPDGETLLVMLRDRGEVGLVSLPVAFAPAPPPPEDPPQDPPGDPEDPPDPPEDPAPEDPAPEEPAVPALRTLRLTQGRLGAAVVADTGARALLYTTVDDPGLPTVVGILDVAAGRVDYRLVRKAIDGVAIDPSGTVAFLRHRRRLGPASDPGNPDQVLAHSDGYSLLSLDTGFARLVTTEAQPQGLLYDPAQPYGFVLVGDGGGLPGSVHRLELTGLAVRTWALGSPPEVVGLLPSVRRAFVTQTHPSGRISFVNLETPDAPLETVSGYTLNSRIE